jgi:hypothetical protein
MTIRDSYRDTLITIHNQKIGEGLALIEHAQGTEISEEQLKNVLFVRALGIVDAEGMVNRDPFSRVTAKINFETRLALYDRQDLHPDFAATVDGLPYRIAFRCPISIPASADRIFASGRDFMTNETCYNSSRGIWLDQLRAEHNRDKPQQP